MIRVWVQKYEAGAFDEDAAAADLLRQYEARIAALEWLVGKQALELEFVKGLVGYAIRRSIDVRLTLAALKAAIERRKPPPGCVHHTDSQRISTSFRAAWLS
jgi:hypothetical protein